MASLTFEFPEKSEENRRIANVCEYCAGTSSFTELAAKKLKNGIVHLAIDHLELAKQNGNRCTQQDTVRWWLSLVEVACKPDCGCAQNLRTHVDWEEFTRFWSQTKIEFAAGERLSQRQKRNLKKNIKAAKLETETEDNTAPVSAPAILSTKKLAKERRKKKKKARNQASKILAGDLGRILVALPPIPPPAIPAALPVDPATGLHITFTATLASHVKPASR